MDTTAVAVCFLMTMQEQKYIQGHQSSLMVIAQLARASWIIIAHQSPADMHLPKQRRQMLMWVQLLKGAQSSQSSQEHTFLQVPAKETEAERHPCPATPRGAVAIGQPMESNLLAILCA